jgi:hypothetical protein
MSASLSATAPPHLEKKPVKFSNLLRECHLSVSTMKDTLLTGEMYSRSWAESVRVSLYGVPARSYERY